MATQVIEVKSKKGTVYLYEDFSYWNKEKGYSTHKRVCIGKKGDDGKPVYNKYYRMREQIREQSGEGGGPRSISSTTLVGETLVLDKVSGETGVRPVLAESLGEGDAEKVMALAYYQLCRGKALSAAGDWLGARGSGNLGLSSQRVSELLDRLTPDKINTFFRLWAEKHSLGGNHLFDLTSVSTYGKRNPYAEFGYNRDGENHLGQINLALLTSCGSGLPLWYQILPGSMSDKVVLDHVLAMMKKMDIPKFTFVGDRGFYSEHNLGILSAGGYKFTIPVPSHIAWQKELIARHRDSLVRPDHLLEEDGSLIYGKTVYEKTGHGRTWHHIYFDPARKDKVIASFMQKLRGLKDELDGEKPVESHKALYDRYFVIKETPVRGRKVSYNDEAIQEFINSDSCYWVLLSTSAKTARGGLEEYRDRNGVELYFDDEKNLFDLRRLKNHNERTVSGKVFVTFVSLIILAALRKKVKQVDRKKRKYWSGHDMLRKVETYAKVHFQGKYKDVHTTPTSAQRLIFDIFGIPYTFKGTDITPEADG